MPNKPKQQKPAPKKQATAAAAAKSKKKQRADEDDALLDALQPQIEAAEAAKQQRDAKAAAKAAASLKAKREADRLARETEQQCHHMEACAVTWECALANACLNNNVAKVAQLIREHHAAFVANANNVKEIGINNAVMPPNCKNDDEIIARRHQYANNDDAFAIYEMLRDAGGKKDSINPNHKTNYGTFRLPLLLGATQGGHIRIIKDLLRLGADPNTTCTQTGANALFTAMMTDFHDIVLLLLPITDVKARTKEGFTLAHIAAQQGSERILQALCPRPFTDRMQRLWCDAAASGGRKRP